MAVITVLGSGIMATALATPLTDNGHEVHLVGTHLDREIITSIQETGIHPNLGLKVPDGVITEGHRLNGVTVMARFRGFEDFTGQSITDIDPADAAHHGRQVRKAVENARENYRIITAGGQAPEPPSALARTVKKVRGTFRRRTPTPATD